MVQLSKVLVNGFRNKLFNIHPSLLPKFGGKMDLDVYKEILKSKEYLTGCTLHTVDEDVDCGKIMLQKQCIT